MLALRLILVNPHHKRSVLIVAPEGSTMNSDWTYGIAYDVEAVVPTQRTCAELRL